MIRCLSTRSAAAHAHSPQPADGLRSVLNCCRRCRWPMSSSSHHLPANLPNAGIERGGEHGSFMSGHEGIPSMKGCLLGMNLRGVLPIRHSARDMCSTAIGRAAVEQGHGARHHMPIG